MYACAYTVLLSEVHNLNINVIDWDLSKVSSNQTESEAWAKTVDARLDPAAPHSPNQPAWISHRYSLRRTQSSRDARYSSAEPWPVCGEGLICQYVRWEPWKVAPGAGHWITNLGVTQGGKRTLPETQVRFTDYLAWASRKYLNQNLNFDLRQIPGSHHVTAYTYSSVLLKLGHLFLAHFFTKTQGCLSLESELYWFFVLNSKSAVVRLSDKVRLQWIIFQIDSRCWAVSTEIVQVQTQAIS